MLLIRNYLHPYETGRTIVYITGRTQRGTRADVAIVKQNSPRAGTLWLTIRRGCLPLTAVDARDASAVNPLTTAIRHQRRCRGPHKISTLAWESSCLVWYRRMLSLQG